MSQKYNNKHNTKQKNYYLIPLIVVSFIPLIVYYYKYQAHLDQYPWFNGSEFVDVFLYWKSVAFIAVNIVMACIICIKIYQECRTKSSSKKYILKKMTPALLPLAIYGLLSLISTIFSQYSYFGFHGIFEQFESVWVLLSYCLTTYYAFLYIRTEDDINTTLRWILAAAGIISIIGIFQAVSLDFYRSSFGQSLFLPSSVESISFTFPPGRVYTSLYNPNYVGSYVSLLIPVLLILIIFNKNIKLRIPCLLLFAGLMICLFGSQSRSGIMAVGISIIFMIIIFRRLLLKYWKIPVISILILLGAFFLVNHLSNNTLINRLSGMFYTSDLEPLLSDIQTNDDNVTIVYKNQKLVIQLAINEDANDFQFTFKDENGNTIPTRVADDNSGIRFNEEPFISFFVKPVMLDDKLGFSVTISGKEWYFTNQTDDGTYYYYTNGGKLDKISPPKTLPALENIESFASNRGFIWSRTIPLLKDNVILGSGADSFTLVYPNDDYIGKYNHNHINTIISKPHNMFLQIGVQTGILSLIAFLGFYFIYFFSSLRLYKKNKYNDYLSQIGAAILAGSFGYMVAGFTNDSTITVAPIFYLLIGTGLSINYQLKKKNNSKHPD